MQGLLGTTQTSVWDCLDPDFDPADRKDLLSQFLNTYSGDFYAHVEDASAREVAQEAMQQHKAFCKVRLLIYGVFTV